MQSMLQARRVPRAAYPQQKEETKIPPEVAYARPQRMKMKAYSLAGIVHAKRISKGFIRLNSSRLAADLTKK
jgi:hypothetical protein